MNKSYNERKIKYLKKNKYKKKSKYDLHRNKCSLNKPFRSYCRIFLNKYKNNLNKLESFIIPSKIPNTYNYYDCKPLKPKCF